MPTSIPLDELSATALKRLKSRLQAEEGRYASERRIVRALIFGATPPQTLGMLNAFDRATAAQDEAESDSDDS